MTQATLSQTTAPTHIQLQSGQHVPPNPRARDATTTRNKATRANPPQDVQENHVKQANNLNRKRSEADSPPSKPKKRKTRTDQAGTSAVDSTASHDHAADKKEKGNLKTQAKQMVAAVAPVLSSLQNLNSKLNGTVARERVAAYMIAEAKDWLAKLMFAMDHWTGVLNDTCMSVDALDHASQQEEIKEATAFLKNLQTVLAIAKVDQLAPSAPMTPHK